MADRPAAVGAAHAGLAVGVAVAVLDVEIVRHMQFEVLDRWGGAHDGGRHSCARATSSAIQPSMRTGLMVSRATTAGACAAGDQLAARPARRRRAATSRSHDGGPRRRRTPRPAPPSAAAHLVAEGERGAARRARSTWRRRAGRRRAPGAVGEARLDDRQDHAAALDLGDRQAQGAQRLDAGDLEVDEVVRRSRRRRRRRSRRSGRACEVRNGPVACGGACMVAESSTAQHERPRA